MKIKELSFLIILILTIGLLTPAAAATLKGSNLWDQEQGMSSTYTWTPAIYSGLWYDTDKGIYTENITLTISASDRQINSENAKYVTEYKPIPFEYAEWGSYRVIGWQGEPYFAGYTRSSSGNMSTAQFANSNISTLLNYKIYPVLLDKSDEKSISASDSYSLENGYKITIKDVDENNKQFRMSLEKNGNVVKEETVSNNTTFVYEKALDNVGTIPIIAVHVKGLNGSKAVINGVFQISESATEVNLNKTIGAMEIVNVNESRIEMKNPNRIRLEKDNTATLMGHIKIDVKDTSKLKFELVSDPKTASEKKYANRGTVYDNSDNIKNWTGMNFAGLSYDYNNSKETESLYFDVSGTLQRNVGPGDIMYQTEAFNTTFNYSDWGGYQALCLDGDVYFAGYVRYNSSDRNNTTNFTNANISVLKEKNISKILIDNGTKNQYKKGTEITLEEGYVLQINNITDNGTKAGLILKKNGNTVKEEKVSSGDNFIYESEVGGEVVPIIAVRVSNVFEGNDAFVDISAVFQISSTAVNVGAGKSIGNMKVEYTGSNTLVFINTDSVSLAKGTNVSLMDNLFFHVADSDDLIFFPYSKSTATTDTSSNIRIEVAETIYPNEQITIKVVYNDSGSWKDLADAEVKVNGNLIGTTNASGTISYTLGSAGEYEFEAKKSGYDTATLKRSTPDGGSGDELQILFPDYIFAKDAFEIHVKDSDNEDVTGASVYKNEVHIGTTNDNGMINVTADSAAGVYKVTANKTGYMTGTREMRVLEYGPYFAVTDLNIPEENLVGKKTKITVTVENVGKEKDTQEVIIKIGDEEITKKITLSPGEKKNVSFSIKLKTAGENTFELTNQTFSFTVDEKPKIEIPWMLILIGGGFLIIFVGAVSALMYYKEIKEEEEKNPRRKSVQTETDSRSLFERLGIGQSEKKNESKSPASKSQKSPASKPNNSRYSNSGKAPELKNSQKRARKEQDKNDK